MSKNEDQRTKRIYTTKIIDIFIMRYEVYKYLIEAKYICCCMFVCVCVLTCMLCFYVSLVFYLHILSEGPFSERTCFLLCSFSQTGLFMLLLCFNLFPFTLPLPTEGRRDRHQVSAVNDNVSAAVAF